MTKIITLKKGLDIRIDGEVPSDSNVHERPAELVALVPDDFPGIVPKILVHVGDTVKKGTPLFSDKFYQDIKVVSPVSGTVEEIARGERRKLLYITVRSGGYDTAADEAAGEAETADSEKTEQALLNSGLWAMMRQLPYGIVPRPSVKPRDIMISLFDSAPLAYEYNQLSESDKDYIRTGVAALGRLTDGKIYLGTREDCTFDCDDAETVIFKGAHPAGNASVQIANIRPVNKGDVIWILDRPTIIRIGKLFKNGELDYSTTVAVTGCEVNRPMLVRTTVGAALLPVLSGQIADDGKHRRIIAGNVLTGIPTSIKGSLRYPYTQVTVIAEGDDKVEFMGWASMSSDKMSESCTFPGRFLKKKFCPDARLNGGRRAMIMSGIYDKYLPMDIMVEFLIKACLSKNLDLMEQLGIYEILPADVALCEYADPSKLELQKIIREGIEYAFHELG